MSFFLDAQRVCLMMYRNFTKKRAALKVLKTTSFKN